MPNIFMFDDAGIHGQPYTETPKLKNYFVNGTLIEHGNKDLVNMCQNKKIELKSITIYNYFLPNTKSHNLGF